MVRLLFISLISLNYVIAIGENPMDINALAGIISGISNMIQKNVETVDVSSAKIMGRWFQMYKAAVNFDVYRKEMFCPIAYFKPNSVMGEDGFSIEEAYRTISKNGPTETFKRDLNKVGPGQYWMYTEEYFYPRQFYIVQVGPNSTNTTEDEAQKSFDYMVVTDANRLALSVYARDPITFYREFNKEVMEFLENSGFGGRIFWNSPRAIYQGADCDWPSEKEVFARRVLKNQEALERSKMESHASSKTPVTGRHSGSEFLSPLPRSTNQLSRSAPRTVLSLPSTKSLSATDSEQQSIVEMLQNPQLALQKLVQGH